MRNIPKPYEKYKHFKGNLYQILTIAEDSETQERQVVYQMLYSPFKIYVRSLQMFMSKVDTIKYPNEIQKYRFEQIIEIETISKNILQSEDFLINNAEITSVEKEESEEIEPLLLEFFDANSYVKKLNILRVLQPKLTNNMVNAIATTLDIEVKEGEMDQRYQELVNCLTTLNRFEGSRLR